MVNSTNNSSNKPSLTNDEVVAGLREALQIGIKNSVNLTSVTDGFLKNNEIRLPFPSDAQKVKDKALEWKLDGQVEKFETTLNRAAEEASKEALPIFADAIKNMSVQDGFSILNGGDGAATKFLKDNTSAKLVSAFSPKVKEATSKVKLTEYWNPIISKYNNAMTLTGGQKLNPDLDAYITQKAIDGLFLMVSKEENKIRKDPAAQVTALLSKVFGSLLK
jgi:enolase